MESQIELKKLWDGSPTHNALALSHYFRQGHTKSLYAALKAQTSIPLKDFIANEQPFIAVVRECLNQDTRFAASLFARMSGFLACAKLAQVCEKWNPAEVLPVLHDAVRYWPQPTDVHEIAVLPSGETVEEKLSAAFDMLQQRGWNVGEAWDMTLFLLNGSLRPVTHEVKIRVLGVQGGSDPTREEEPKGYTGTLTLEWIENSRATEDSEGHKGIRLERHPETFRLPCDQTFQSALSSAVRWAEKQTWAQTGAAVRWNLVMEQSEGLQYAAGNSLGGAFALGLNLLLTGQQEDRTIAITGGVNEAGKLTAVGDVLEKCLGALRAQTLHPIFKIIVPEGQQHPDLKDSGGQSIEIVEHSYIMEAVETFLHSTKPYRAIQAKIHAENSVFPVPGEADSAFDSALYLPLPLLEEIEVKQLDASEKRRRGPSGEEREEREVEQAPLHRLEEYEEWRQKVTIRYSSPIQLEDIFSAANAGAVSRRVVVGPPGSGKTTLSSYLAWRMTNPNDPLLVAGKLTLPVFVRLREWNNSKIEDLATFLKQRYLKEGHFVSSELWTTWLTQGRLFLLLDGLDEVPSAFLGNIKAQLDAWSKCSALITCRSVNRDRLKDAGLSDRHHVYTPSPVKQEDQKQYIEHYPHAHYKSEVLLEELQKPAVQLMATNPLLLSILCIVADDPRGGMFPSTRTEVYRLAVEKILQEHLTEKPKVEIFYPETIAHDYKLQALENLALQLFLNHERKNDFPETEAVQILERFCTSMGYGRLAPTKNVKPAALVSRLLEDFRKNSRLLKGKEGAEYSFLHLTFQEYLAAAALARRAEEVNFVEVGYWDKAQWEKEFYAIDSYFENAAKCRYETNSLTPLQNYLALLDHNAWQPYWHEIFLFLAGSLEDPVPLLDLLSDRYISRDDMFRHRLALAALCLGEIRED